MKVKNILTNILSGIQEVSADQWNFAWSKGTPKQVRFPNASYEAIRVSEDFLLVRVPKQEAPAGKTTTA